jgi:hypothetical protein
MTSPLVEFPELVEHYAPFFESVFSEQALVQFQRYISGLIVSENKTVDGINRIFVHETRNQSSLNRLLTESPFSLEALNQARLALLGSLPDTRFKPKGVLSVDNTLLTHYGRHFDQIAYLYDPTEKRYTWAHDLVNVHYSDDQTDYPAYFQLWKPADLEKIEKGLRAAQIPLRESKLELKETDTKKWRQYLLGVWRRHQSKPEVVALYESKLVIARQLLRRWVSEHPELKLPVTFDNWYTQPAFCRFLDKELDLPYVGTLANDDVVILKSGQETLESFAERLKQEHLTAIASGGRPVFRKIGIHYKGEKETYRWPVEVYHEEGKAEGLDQYQIRDFQAISRHIGLVAVVYSLLRAAPHDEILLHKLQRQLKFDLDGSAAFWRRATEAQSLWCLACFIAVGLAQGQSLHQLMAPLLAAVCY